MNEKVLRDAKRYNTRRRRRKVWKRIVSCLGTAVVFVTTYMLILPAITMESETFCGHEEHAHDDSCYVQVVENGSQVLLCSLESLGLHSHSESCFDAEGRVVCGRADYVVHSHGELCFDGEGRLVCTLPEMSRHEHDERCYAIIGAHTHDDGCWADVRGELICEIPEEQGHAHSSECYVPGEELVCITPENHVHGEECFDGEAALICTIPEGHVHDELCYEPVLNCGVEEREGHSHTDECYEVVSELICQLEESEGELSLVCTQHQADEHIHTQDCFGFAADDTLTCTLEENGEHTHGERCYGTWTLDCGMEEHSHGKQCYSDQSADVETAAQWEASFAHVRLSGKPAEDVLAIAATQMGYRESVKNYYVSDDGLVTRGYTRYGDWYGDSYGDWCAMFVSFCIHYAQVEGFPLEAYCPKWVKLLEEEEIFFLPGEYEPMPGDIVFFDWEEDGIVDHVGLVDHVGPSEKEETEEDYLHTIEGNSDDRVAEKEYKLDDPVIVGYGKLPENPEEAEEELPDEDDELLEGGEADTENDLTVEDDPVHEDGLPPGEGDDPGKIEQEELEFGGFGEIFSLINQTGTQMYHHEDYLEYQYSSHRVNDYMTLTYVLIPYEARDVWQPNTRQWSANTNANYVVAYCADRATDVSETGETYTTYRIQDSAYYSSYTEVLSGIVGHAYPFLTADEMKQELREAYLNGEIAVDVSCCTESEFIAAAQWAIWDMTGISGTQTTASGSAFPSYNVDALNPLSDVGHTDASDIQSHVKAIRDWLVTQRAPDDLKIVDHESIVSKNADGTYDISATVYLDRGLEDGEELTAGFTAGNVSSEMTVSGFGTDSFTLLVQGVDAEEVLGARVTLDISFEHMQVYVYDSVGYQDMISGQWGTDEYQLGFTIEPELTSVNVTKHWADGQPGAEYIEVQLYADGERYGLPQRLSSANNWSYTWDELLKYSSADVKVNYDVKEILIPGYYSSVAKDESGSSTIVSLDESSGFEEGGTYVLSYNNSGSICAVADMGGSLDWVRDVNLSRAATVPDNAMWIASGVSADGSNAYLCNKATGAYLCYDGSYITLSSYASAKTYFMYNHLYLLNGDYNQYLLYFSGGVGFVTNEWDGALPVSLYKYNRVTHEKADICFMITNTPTTEMISVSVTKQWAGREDGDYPESVEVVLLQNGTRYGSSVILSEENGWYHLWEDLPLKVGDMQFVYTVEETEIKDYTASLTSAVDEEGTFAFTLTNTWSPDYVPLVLTKVDAADHSLLLPGAQFALYLAAEETEEAAVVVPGTVDSYGIFDRMLTIAQDGSCAVENLMVGRTYYLVETAAPVGYNRMTVPIVFTVGRDENGHAILGLTSGESWTASCGTDENGEMQMTVINQKGYVLPETGGIGTAPYIIGGLLLCTAAVILLCYNFKPRRKEEPTSS